MPNRPPLTESPWFWVCLFASMGLVALWAIGERYDVRQTQVEQKAQGRMRAAERAAGGEMTTEVSSRGHLEVSLRPLFVVLGVIVIAGWIALWWRYWRPAAQASSDASGSPSDAVADRSGQPRDARHA